MKTLQIKGRPTPCPYKPSPDGMWLRFWWPNNVSKGKKTKRYELKETWCFYSFEDFAKDVEQFSFGYCYFRCEQEYSLSGRRNRFAPEYPHTMLRQCIKCGKWSTPKKIQYRYFRSYHYKKSMHIEKWESGNMCMPCYNKIKPLAKAREDVEEARYLINRIYIEELKCRKSKQQATSESTLPT